VTTNEKLEFHTKLLNIKKEEINNSINIKVENELKKKFEGIRIEKQKKENEKNKKYSTTATLKLKDEELLTIDEITEFKKTYFSKFYDNYLFKYFGKVF
jgi:hypothetical protein